MIDLPVPSTRIASPDVVRVLREVEEAKNPLTLAWEPESREWQVLMWDRAPGRLQEGEALARSIDYRDGSIQQNLRRMHLMRAGFSGLAIVTEADYTSPSWLRDHVQRLLLTSERERERMFEEGLDASEGIPRQRHRIAVWRDFRETDGRLVEKVFQRGRTAMSYARNLLRKIA